MMNRLHMNYLKSFAIFVFSEDGWCRQVRRHLTTTGKGRPPKLPISPESHNPTNLQLVQIYEINQLNSTVDLKYVGPFCSALVIDRDTLLNIALLNECTFPVGALTVGILLELDKFQVVEKLDNHLMVQWLFKIGSLSALPQEDTVVKLVVKVKGDFHKINKC